MKQAFQPWLWLWWRRRLIISDRASVIRGWTGFLHSTKVLSPHDPTASFALIAANQFSNFETFLWNIKQQDIKFIFYKTQNGREYDYNNCKIIIFYSLDTAIYKILLCILNHLNYQPNTILNVNITWIIVDVQVYARTIIKLIISIIN